MARFCREGYEVLIERIGMSSSRSTSAQFSTSEASESEDSITSETSSNVDLPSDQTSKDTIYQDANCGTSSSKLVVPQTPDSGIDAEALPRIEDEDSVVDESSLTEMDNVMFDKLLDIDDSFNLEEYMEITTCPDVPSERCGTGKHR